MISEAAEKQGRDATGSHANDEVEVLGWTNEVMLCDVFLDSDLFSIRSRRRMRKERLRVLPPSRDSMRIDEPGMLPPVFPGEERLSIDHSILKKWRESKIWVVAVGKGVFLWC